MRFAITPFPRHHPMTTSMRRTSLIQFVLRHRHRLIAAAGAGCAALAAALYICDTWVARSADAHMFSSSRPPPACDVALVLGTTPTLADGRRNLFFQYRIDAAAELFHAGHVKHLLLSGDNGTRTYDEATAMQTALIARGVPSSAMTLDYAGFRTLDSVARAQLVFGQSRLLIVSQPFHAQRAVFLARARGIDAFAYVARDPVGAAATKVRIRETLARTAAVLDVHVLHTGPKYTGPYEPIAIASE